MTDVERIRELELCLEDITRITINPSINMQARQISGIRELAQKGLDRDQIFKSAAREMKELRIMIEKYKHLTKERGEFIINGEDLGYISVPTSENDKAYYTFLRCKITDEAAVLEI